MLINKLQLLKLSNSGNIMLSESTNIQQALLFRYKCRLVDYIINGLGDDHEKLIIKMSELIYIANSAKYKLTTKMTDNQSINEEIKFIRMQRVDNKNWDKQ